MVARLRLAAQRLLARITRQVVGRHTWALVVQTPEGRFAVDPEDQGVGRQLRLHGAYNAVELTRLRQLIQPDDRLLVVGAHVGALTIPLARGCRSVLALEPNPDSFSLLQMNLWLNGTFNCRALPLAANDRAGALRFLLNRTNSGGSKRAPLVDDGRYRHDRPREVSVHAVRLDDELPGECADVVLMDIEGSELFALRGMPQLLASCRCLVVEFLPHHLQQVAGTTPGELLSAIPAQLRWLWIPSTDQHMPRDQAQATLEAMMLRGQGDDGLVFSRDRL